MTVQRVEVKKRRSKQPQMEMFDGSEKKRRRRDSISVRRKSFIRF